MRHNRLIHTLNELVEFLTIAVYDSIGVPKKNAPSKQQLLQMTPTIAVRVMVVQLGTPTKPKKTPAKLTKEFLWNTGTTMTDAIEKINHQNKFPLMVSLI